MHRRLRTRASGGGPAAGEAHLAPARRRLLGMCPRVREVLLRVPPPPLAPQPLARRWWPLPRRGSATTPRPLRRTRSHAGCVSEGRRASRGSRGPSWADGSAGRSGSRTMSVSPRAARERKTFLISFSTFPFSPRRSARGLVSRSADGAHLPPRLEAKGRLRGILPGRPGPRSAKRRWYERDPDAIVLGKESATIPGVPFEDGDLRPRVPTENRWPSRER